MAQKEQKKVAGNKAQAGKGGAKVATATAKTTKKGPKEISYHRILVKCTNGKSFYTYSTIGKANEEVSISAYTDPFVHEVWNKDKKRVISKDNPFTKRFGSLTAKKQENE